jgi:hypothetical protein
VEKSRKQMNGVWFGLATKVGKSRIDPMLNLEWIIVPKLHVMISKAQSHNKDGK